MVESIFRLIDSASIAQLHGTVFNYLIKYFGLTLPRKTMSSRRFHPQQTLAYFRKYPDCAWVPIPEAIGKLVQDPAFQNIPFTCHFPPFQKQLLEGFSTEGLDVVEIQESIPYLIHEVFHSSTLESSLSFQRINLMQRLYLTSDPQLSAIFEAWRRKKISF